MSQFISLSSYVLEIIDLLLYHSSQPSQVHFPEASEMVDSASPTIVFRFSFHLLYCTYLFY